jgi:hypothetical protein
MGTCRCIRATWSLWMHDELDHLSKQFMSWHYRFILHSGLSDSGVRACRQACPPYTLSIPSSPSSTSAQFSKLRHALSKVLNVCLLFINISLARLAPLWHELSSLSPLIATHLVTVRPSYTPTPTWSPLVAGTVYTDTYTEPPRGRLSSTHTPKQSHIIKHLWGGGYLQRLHRPNSLGSHHVQAMLLLPR